MRRGKPARCLKIGLTGGGKPLDLADKCIDRQQAPAAARARYPEGLSTGFAVHPMLPHRSAPTARQLRGSRSSADRVPALSAPPARREYHGSAMPAFSLPVAASSATAVSILGRISKIRHCTGARYRHGDRVWCRRLAMPPRRPPCRRGVFVQRKAAQQTENEPHAERFGEGRHPCIKIIGHAEWQTAAGDDVVCLRRRTANRGSGSGQSAKFSGPGRIQRNGFLLSRSSTARLFTGGTWRSRPHRRPAHGPPARH